MKQRLLACLVLTAGVTVAAASTMSAQQRPASRTRDGRPDLQGVWSYATLTPLERSAEFAGRDFLTDAQVAEFRLLSRSAAAGAVPRLDRHRTTDGSWRLQQQHGAVPEFTVDDPATWTRPWTAQIPMTKSREPIFEYACPEGNYSLFHILVGAREQEKTQQ